MARVAILILAFSLGNTDYDVRLRSHRILAYCPPVAMVSSIACWYHPDAEVRHQSWNLWPHAFSKWCGTVHIDPEIRLTSYIELGIIRDEERYQPWLAGYRLHVIKTLPRYSWLPLR